MDKRILLNIKDCLKSADVLEGAVFYHSLSGMTTIGAGGKCLCFLKIHTRRSLFALLEAVVKNNIRFLIIGNGSNILFGDGLHNMIIIKLEGEFNYIEFMHDDLVKAGAGYNLQKFIVKAAKNGFDLSFLGGVPGTVGGAVIGNSGTGESGINSFLKTVDYISVIDEVVEKKQLEIKPENVYYRFLNIGELSVITDITLRINKADPYYIFMKIRENIKKKKRLQPLDTKNAGCFFKNPENGKLKAGAVIDNCKLKGFTYGGAKISEKHANFIENISNASAKDIFILSKIIQDSVKTKYGIDLENEVSLVGLNER